MSYKGEIFISVIMSVYNSEKHLRKSIESILSQSYENFEFIIVDDFSNDSSWKIIQDYSAKDKRINAYRREKNLGLTKNLNFMINKSKGEFIARMDSDDISLKNRLYEQIEYMKNNPKIDILGTASIEIDNEEKCVNIKKYPEEDFMNYICKASPVLHPTVMLKSSVFSKLSYNEKFRTSQDLDLWFRCLKNGYKFANINTPLLKFRMDKDFFKRRSVNKSINEFYIYITGIYSLHGISIKLIYPFFRLFFRILPQSFVSIFYKSYVRKIFLKG